MTFIDVERLAAAANADGEFQLHARLWRARVSLRAGDNDPVGLTIAAGRVAAGNDSDTPADVRISAPAGDWDALLAPLPRPFFHDLRAACAHHGFRLEGDRLHTAAFYPAIRRLVDLMRDVHQGAPQGDSPTHDTPTHANRGGA